MYGLSGNLRQRAQRLTGRVWINHTEEEQRVDAQVQRILENALATRRTVSMRYTDLNGHATERRVDPQLLGKTFGSWYLVAYCHQKQGIRWFRLDRIDSAHLTAQASIDRVISEIGAPPDTAQPVWT